MQIYQLNENLDYCFEDGKSEPFEWIVYHYTEGCYDGNGVAVAKTKEGKLHHYDLGHCSCYGPFEDLGSNECETTIEELKELMEKLEKYNDVDDYYYKIYDLPRVLVYRKALELV